MVPLSTIGGNAVQSNEGKKWSRPRPRNGVQRSARQKGQTRRAAIRIGGRCKFGGICNASRTLGGRSGCPLQA
jgi:hypothetical protein